MGKLKGSGARIVSDLLHKLNDVRKGLYAKAKGLREAGKCESSQGQSKGSGSILESGSNTMTIMKLNS